MNKSDFNQDYMNQIAMVMKAQAQIKAAPELRGEVMWSDSACKMKTTTITLGDLIDFPEEEK